MTAPTRLWFASPHFYPTYGGAQNRYRHYIPGLLARGLDVQLLTGTPLLEERTEADADLNWYQAAPGDYLPESQLDGAPLQRVRLPDHKGRVRTRIFYDSLAQMCAQDAAGAVVAQLLTNLRPEAKPWVDQLKNAGVATLYSVSQFPSWPSKPTKRLLRGSGYRKVYNAFDALVTNSPAIEVFLRDIGVTTRIEYIPNGVDLQRFRPPDTEQLQCERNALRSRLGIDTRAPVMITVGSIMPRKGPDLAIQAWRRLLSDFPDLHLLLVGPRQDKYDERLAEFSAGLEQSIADSGAPQQVHFSGQIDDVENWLRAADVFVLPTNREGTPNSVLEAMATGLPTVVTEFTGLSSAIGQPGKHFQLVKREADAIAAPLREWLADKNARVLWGESGVSYIRHEMDQRITLDRYTNLYIELGQRALQRHRAPGLGPATTVAVPPTEFGSPDRPPLLVLGAPPRGGNHLLRGLLDNHPQLLLPPDEDYFIRHLSRHPLLQLRGMLVSPDRAPAFFRKLQKDGHLERVNAGMGTEVFGSEGSLDLEAYYRYVQAHHRRASPDSLVRNHVEAMAAALGHSWGDERMRVCFCALQPSNHDVTRVGALLSRSYRVRGVFLVRDPRAHLASKLMRNPGLSLSRFCRRQNRYWNEMDVFAERFGPVLRLRFEQMITDTETAMREVCDFVGIEFTPRMLEYTQGGVASLSNSSFDTQPGIDREVLTRYQDVLPAETVDYLYQHCRPELFWDTTREFA
ncbi:MAG: glycosyltransferase [Pseudomonadota bacterium]